MKTKKQRVTDALKELPMLIIGLSSICLGLFLSMPAMLAYCIKQFGFFVDVKIYTELSTLAQRISIAPFVIIGIGIVVSTISIIKAVKHTRISFKSFKESTM